MVIFNKHPDLGARIKMLEEMKRISPFSIANVRGKSLAL